MTAHLGSDENPFITALGSYARKSRANTQSFTRSSTGALI
jgi:hypothetical protein